MEDTKGGKLEVKMSCLDPPVMEIEVGCTYPLPENKDGSKSTAGTMNSVYSQIVLRTDRTV